MKISKTLLRQTFLGIAIACVFTPLSASAHHILGVPHYNYDERYPQTPVLTYRAELHNYEVEMTGYPGKPEPGERCSLHVYIRSLDTGEVFDDTVTLSVARDRAIVRDAIIYGPMEAQLEESMYKFFPRFDQVGNYLIEIAFVAEGDHWVIQLPMKVGEPTSPWISIGGPVLGASILLLLARAARIKMKRRVADAPAPTLASADPDTSEMA